MTMKAYFCEHESAVLEALEWGRWPHGCAAELRAHVARCVICADVVLVARILQPESRASARARRPCLVESPIARQARSRCACRRTHRVGGKGGNLFWCRVPGGAHTPAMG